MERIIKFKVNGWYCGTDLECFYRVPEGITEKELQECLYEIAVEHLAQYEYLDEEDDFIEKEYDFFYEDASAEQAEEEGYEVEEW